MAVAAAPLIGAVASGAVTFATGATFFGLTGIAAALASFATTFALGLVSNLLTPKPKLPKVTGLDGSRTTMVRQPIPPMEVIYGELRKSGAIVLAENTENNKYIHLVIVVSCHELEAINTVYVNGVDPIFNDQINPSTGAVTGGKYAGKMWIKKHLGDPDQAVDPLLDSEISKVDGNFRLRECGYVYVKYETDRDLFPSGAQFTFRIKGRKMYDTRTSTTIYSCNPALMWRDYLTNTKFGKTESTARIDDTFVTAAANTNDEFVNTKAVSHTVVSTGVVANSLKLAGAILQFQTGDRVEVTTTGSAPTGLATSTNYYAIVEKESSTDSTGLEIRFASSYLNALAGTGISVSSAGSGTVTIVKNGEPRYAASGMFRLTEDTDPAEILESMLNSMAGFGFKPGGKWQIYSGTYQSPSASYDIYDLAGSGIKVTTKQTRSIRFNGVRGTNISPINYDQPDNFPAVVSADAVTADGGEQRFHTHDLPWTPRAQTAQRICKILLSLHRRQETASITLNASGLLVQPGNTIEFTYDRYGWDTKTWRVEDWEFSAIEGNGDEPPGLGVTLMLREIDSAAFDFDEDSEEVVVEPPPSSSLPNPFARPEAPSNLVLSSGSNELYIAGDGTIISRIKATFDDSVNHYVKQYIVKWKESMDSVYQTAVIRSDRTGSNTHYIAPVKDGVEYDVQIYSMNHLGVTSLDYAEELNYEVVGKTEPPPKPSSFTVARMADGTRRFTFDLLNPPADVRVGGGYKLRWYLGTTSDWSAMTPLHDGVLTLSPFETNELAAGIYTFALKTVDSSGNESTDALFINATLGNPRLRNALLQQFEHPAWEGTKTNCFVDSDGWLHATSNGDWDDLGAEWNDLAASWDNILTNNSPITYETLEIDLGTDVTFTPLITLEGDGTQTIEIKTGTDADGSVVGSYAAPSGQETARYLQVRVQLSGTTPIAKSLTIICDGDVTVEEFNDVVTSTESSAWFSSTAAGHFKVGSRDGDLGVITSAKIVALQNVGPGWTWELISKSQTVNSHVAAEFKVYNSSGTLADATVDIELRGPTSL